MTTNLAQGNAGAQENPDIPAGYTYFGQFITHDLTFDPSSLTERRNDPEGLLDFRTPRFDLDCLYGRGPDDQPYLYEPNGRLTEGEAVSSQRQYEGPDLPRASNGRAIIGDPRNDENKLISQFHSLFIRFHNHVLGTVGGDFDQAQRLVRWQYQWLVLWDFLPKFVPKTLINAIVGQETLDFPTAGGGTVPMTRVNPTFRYYRPHKDAFLPVEFSAAAFRFGHSMVRDSYRINDVITPANGRRLPLFAANGEDLRSFGPLPTNWGIQWGHFFPVRYGQQPQSSFRIDERLSSPLGALPSAIVPDPPPSQAEAARTQLRDPPRSLPWRTLQRGVNLGLPSGQDVALLLGVSPIPDEQLFEESRSEEKGLRAIFRGSAPLWYYILRESAVVANGKSLGPVGATIVAEVIIGLLWKDPQSFLRQDPNWKPLFGENMKKLLENINANI